jgi:hypothetical protein
MKNPLPLAVGFMDYHEIHNIAESLRPRIKVKEVAFDGEYWALFYQGKLPNRKIIRKVLERDGWDSNHEYAELYTISS